MFFLICYSLFNVLNWGHPPPNPAFLYSKQVIPKTWAHFLWKPRELHFSKHPHHLKKSNQNCSYSFLWFNPSRLYRVVGSILPKQILTKKLPYPTPLIQCFESRVMVNTSSNKYGSTKNCRNSSLSAPAIFLCLQVWDNFLIFFNEEKHTDKIKNSIQDIQGWAIAIQNRILRWIITLRFMVWLWLVLMVTRLSETLLQFLNSIQNMNCVVEGGSQNRCQVSKKNFFK